MPLLTLWDGAQVSSTESTSPSYLLDAYATSSSQESPTSTPTSPLLSPAWKWKILTVKPRYLSQILAGCKVWEVRKRNCKYRGNVAVVASGTKKIWGSVVIVGSSWKSLGALQRSTGHCIPSDCLAKFCSKDGSPGAYVWTMEQTQVFKEPLPFRRVPGCVTWTLPDSNTVQMIESAPVLTKHICAQQLFESIMLCRRRRLKCKNNRKRMCIR